MLFLTDEDRLTNGCLIYDLHLFLICLLINSADAILDIPLVSIRIEIVKPDKVGTFIIVVKCFFLNYPKNGQGELTTPELQAQFLD